MARGVVRFRQDFGDRAGPGFLIHSGEEILPLAEGVIALPFSRF
jgi:hypothetical protein